MAKKNWVWTLVAILALAGGAVHVGLSYGLFQILPIFGSWANLVQLLAGGSGIALAVKSLMKK